MRVRLVWIFQSTIFEVIGHWITTISQNWCLGQFYHSIDVVLKNCSAFFVSVSLVRENLGELRLFFSQNPNLSNANS